MRLRLILASLFLASPALALPAFPGAEGPGAAATGGRGGKVIKVTTLNPTGAGSLQAALSASGPRIIVFTVSGVIKGHLQVDHGNFTIAGQTAPGGGITIEGQLKSETDEGNMILRHLRIRPPVKPGNIDGQQYDAVQLGEQTKLIIDHCSISWGVDETVDVYRSSETTVQWSTIAEAIMGGHPEKDDHNFGLIQGEEAHKIAIHHNLFAHNKNRNPAIANGPAEVRNNVVYNVRHGFIHQNVAAGEYNIVGNYYKQGPDDSLIPFFFDDEDENLDRKYWLADNFIDDPADGCNRIVENPWTDACHPSFEDTFNTDLAPVSVRATKQFNFAASNPGWVAVTTQPVKQAYDLVLARSGAAPRDAIDKRIVEEVKARTGRWSTQAGDRPSDLMAGLTPGQAPADADNDGMADAWETEHGLNPKADDSKTVRPSGYTAIEEYINELADGLAGKPPGGTTPDGTVVPNPDGSAPNAAGPNAGGAADGGTSGGSESDSGCGCHLEPSSAAPSAGAAIALALAWLSRRRRRG